MSSWNNKLLSTCVKMDFSFLARRQHIRPFCTPFLGTYTDCGTIPVIVFRYKTWWVVTGVVLVHKGVIVVVPFKKQSTIRFGRCSKAKGRWKDNKTSYNDRLYLMQQSLRAQAFLTFKCCLVGCFIGSLMSSQPMQKCQKDWQLRHDTRCNLKKMGCLTRLTCHHIVTPCRVVSRHVTSCHIRDRTQ